MLLAFRHSSKKDPSMKAFTLAALAAAIGFAPSSEAVYVSLEGQGEALIYPYYTAQSLDAQPFNTYLSIVNQSQWRKSLRVRLREGRNGRAVFSFNLYLGPRDTWAGAIVPDGEGANLITADASCTSPALGASNPLSPASFQGASADGYGEETTRVREGYVEVIEMATLADTATDPSNDGPTCDEYRAEALERWLRRPNGGLSGTLTLINVATGLDFTVAADALADLSTAPFHRAPDSSYPDFDAAEIAKHSSFVRDGWFHRSSWATGLHAVEAALMQGIVANEVVLDAATRSGTDWIVTLPTKRFHAASSNMAPFGFRNDERSVPLRLDFTPRDGRTIHFNIDFPPMQPFVNNADLRLRWDSTVLSFRRAGVAAGAAGISSVLGSRNAWIVDLPTSAENGSAQVGWSGSLSMTGNRMRASDGLVAPENAHLFGLPVVGFMVRSFRNDAVPCNGGSCQGNYGGAFPHRYERHLYPSPATAN